MLEIDPTRELLLILAFCASMGTAFADFALNTFVSANYSPGPLNWLHASFGLAANVSIWETIRVPMVVLVVPSFFVYGGMEISSAQPANTLSIDGRGITQATAGFCIALYWRSFTIGRVLMGSVADHISTRLILRSGMIRSIIGALFLTLKPDPAFLFIGPTLIGFSLVAIVATLIVETPRHVGLRYAANTIGFEVGMINPGAAFLPGLGGLLAEHISLDIIGPFLLMIAIIMFVLHEFVVVLSRP